MSALNTIEDSDLNTLLLIRHLELALLDLFAAGEINGTIHTCLGQEYIPVALSPLLKGDFIFSNHRGHGHYVAHTDDPTGLLAEILGREGAPCSGVGGSQHLHRGGFHSTGVQGESLPIAVGAALHSTRVQPGRIAAVYIGDGTFGEGVVYEALNIASLWQLPLLVIVENNGIAQSTPTERHLAGTVAGRAAAFDIGHHRLTTTNVVQIRAELAPVVSRVRIHHMPAIVEFATVRLGPHSKGDDTRSADELASLRKQDWFGHYAEQLGRRFAESDLRQREHVAALVNEVRQRPLATWGATR